MARFYGVVGYGTTTQTSPGVWTDSITEVSYFGDVVQNSRLLQQAAQVNDNLSVNTSLSIVADAYVFENFLAIRYVEWMGTRWTVSNVTVARPRLVLELGGVYNGPTS